MKNKISVIMTAVGLSVASLSAHSAVNAYLVIDDAAPAPMTITGSIDILSFSFGASQTAVIGQGGVNISDPITGGAFTMGTVTMNPNSTETFALSDPMGGCCSSTPIRWLPLLTSTLVSTTSNLAQPADP